MNTPRRTFVKTLSLGAMSLPFISCGEMASQKEAAEESEPEKKPGQIGIQLWTIREAIEKDLPGALARLAEMGFAGVETAFWPEHLSLTEAAKLLESLNLPVLAAHCEIPTSEHRNQFLEMADAYQCKYMVWHGWPEDERYQSLEGTKELAGMYEEANAFAAEHGLIFGLHNHWWEFEPMKDDPRMPFEYLLEHLSDQIIFEIDTYWAKVAGQNPAEILTKWGKRAPLLHIKDGPGVHEKPMVAVGSGVQDFPAMVNAADGATEWMIVEMDECATDMFEAVQASYDYLTKNNLATGRE